MKKIKILMIVLVLAGLTSCDYYGPCIDGIGPVSTEVRSIEGFKGISNAASFEVYITQEDNFYVEVQAQENLMPYIETFVSGSTLIIQTETGACLRNTVPVRIYVSLPEITLLSLAGSGSIYTNLIEEDNLEMVLSGSGRIDVDSIFCRRVDLRNSASGIIFCNYLDAESVHVNLSGSGTIESGIVIKPLNLNVNHSSSGTVRMTVDSGSRISTTLSGSGRVMLFGDANESTFVNAGSGKTDALNLLTGSCVATNSGSGNILVYVTDHLQATIVGSGDIVYRGDPEVSYVITGSGRLRRY